VRARVESDVLIVRKPVAHEDAHVIKVAHRRPSAKLAIGEQPEHARFAGHVHVIRAQLFAQLCKIDHL
jgi:hypothetical protein